MHCLGQYEARQAPLHLRLLHDFSEKQFIVNNNARLLLKVF
jgi:hypothetical protein